ncbi:MAG: family 20 glycosylhydrolase [Bacteroides sp.]|nr:family 20 glycosylhydrolase [Bacteroides sp.]
MSKTIKHREGYTLIVRDGRASIKAQTQAGLLYGLQTLTQLAQDATERKLSIPACAITDHPSTDYRAIHIDLKHHLDKKEYMYQVLRRMAYYKLNAAIVEYEDKLGYESYPIVAAPNAPSIAQWKEWAEYAHQLNIDISPLIQGIGHADFILKHDEMKPLREAPTSDWVCCPSNKKYYDVQFGLYADAMRATPHGKYLHVGGDEVGTLGVCPVCKAKQKTALQHQMEWLKRVSDFAVANGRTPIFWDDMVFKHVGLYEVILDQEKPERMDSIWAARLPELNKHINLFPKKVVYMRWQYGNANMKGNKMALKWYNDNGLSVMGATAAQTTCAMLPTGNGNFKNIESFQLAHQTTPIIGVLCTAWDDASPLFDTFWKGFIAHGQYSWNIATPMKYNELDHRYHIREFGVAASELPDFRKHLESTFPLWEEGLLDKGFRRGMWRTGGKYTILSLPTKEKGAWSRTYAERIEKAQKGCIEQLQLQQLLMDYRNKATRNDYSLQVFERINDVTGYTARLLVALSTYDRERDASSLNNLRQCAENFKTVRHNFEEVCAQTRHMGQPDGYILPMNHHAHLAIRTANTDWMFLFEIDFLKQIDELLAAEGLSPVFSATNL